MHTISFFWLCLLVLIVPWEGNFFIAGLPTAARALGLLAFVLGILKVFASGRLRPLPWAMVWFALFIGWCLVAPSWSIKPDATIDRAVTYVLLLPFVWLIWELADTPRRQKAIMRALVVGTTLLVFNVYLRSLSLGISLASEERATATNANPNGVAVNCCFAIQFAFFLITRREKGKVELPNWFLWGFIAAAAIAVPMTGSRAGLATALVASLTFLPVLLKATRQSGWKNVVMLLVIAAVIGIMVPKLVPKAVFQRLGEGTQANTFVERRDSWDRGLRAWRQTPLLGTGPGTYQFINTGGVEGLAAHSTFISVLVESGIIGCTLYFAFWVLVVRSIFRMSGNDRFFWLVFFASLMPIMLTASAEYSKYWWMVGALIMCQAANPKPVRSEDRRFPVHPVRTPGLAPPPRRPSAS